jgi:hypothetical protein
MVKMVKNMLLTVVLNEEQEVFGVYSSEALANEMLMKHMLSTEGLEGEDAKMEIGVLFHIDTVILDD